MTTKPKQHTYRLLRQKEPRRKGDELFLFCFQAWCKPALDVLNNPDDIIRRRITSWKDAKENKS